MKRTLFTLQKKDYLYIAAGFFCVAVIGFCLSFMDRFQKDMEYREYQYNTGSYIAYFSGGLSEQDIAKIAEDADVTQCGIETYYKKIAEGNGKDVWIRGANENLMLRNSIVSEGRLPESRNEIVAEKWVLEALGIEAASGQRISFLLEDEEGNRSVEEFIVSGILQDSAYTKADGTINLFIPYNLKTDRYLVVHLDINEKADLFRSLERIKGKLTGENVFYEYSSEAGVMRQQRNGLTKKQWAAGALAGCVLFIYLFCVYQLSEERFMQNMSKLRMCGLSMRKILNGYFQIILAIAGISVLLGTVAGRLAVFWLVKMSHLDQVKFVFWGERRGIDPGVYLPMFFLVLIFSFFTLLPLFMWISFRSTRGSILSQLRYGENAKRKTCYMKKRPKGGKLLYFKLEWFSIILACMSGILVLSVDYKQQSENSKSDMEVFSQCRNGDFQILGYQSENIENGATKEQIAELERLSGTDCVETAMVLPVRVKMENGLSVAQDYYEMYNEYAKDTYYKEFIGTEKTSGELVYKSSLMGYNDTALEKLSDYVIDGTIDIEAMKSSNTAVLFVPQYVEGKYRQRFYKNADQVMDYKVGDYVTVKIRDDYSEDMEHYWSMEDTVGSHEESFRISAIVYYPYLPNTSALGLINPDVIVSDIRMEKLTKQQVYRVVNIQMKEEEEPEEYGREVSAVFSSVGGITVTNFVSARKEQQMRNRIYTIVGNLWTCLVGAGLLSCAAAGIKHHVLLRRKDLALCRMIGFSKRKLHAEARNEGILYFGWISVFTISIAYVLQKLIFTHSGMQVLGLSFWGNEYHKIVLLLVYWGIIECLFIRNTGFMLRGEIMEGYKEE